MNCCVWAVLFRDARAMSYYVAQHIRDRMKLHVLYVTVTASRGGVFLGLSKLTITAFSKSIIFR